MPHGCGITHLLCGLTRERPEAVGDDEVIAQVAAAQHGVVARWQLLDLGVTPRSIDHRLCLGRLRRVYAGRPAAYAVGHSALSTRGRAVAAVITVGPGAAASHWTKLTLVDLLDKPRPLIHVTSSRERSPRRGLFIHRAVIAQDEVEITDGIPSLSLPRTFLDLSAQCSDPQLRTILKRAEFRGLLRIEEIVSVLARYPRRRGRGALARIASGFAFNAGRTNSPIEDEFAEFCGRWRIPPPELNAPIVVGGHTRIIDCVWRDARLVAELDGRDAHARELAFADDRERDRALTVLGWKPIRITRGQMRFDAQQLAADLLRLTSAG